jgi:hypothetical protein
LLFPVLFPSFLVISLPIFSSFISHLCFCPTFLHVCHIFGFSGTPYFIFTILSLIGVGIVTGYGLDDREVGVCVLVRSRFFSGPTLLSNGYRG